MVSLLQNYDYVVLNTGYTSRIPLKFGEHTKKVINELLFPYEEHDKGQNHLVCIADKLWGKYNKNEFVLYGDMNDYEFVKSVIDVDGIILLKNINLNKIYEIVSSFGDEEYSFCACCSINNIYKMDLHEKDNKKILYVCVDTESG